VECRVPDGPAVAFLDRGFLDRGRSGGEGLGDRDTCNGAVWMTGDAGAGAASTSISTVDAGAGAGASSAAISTSIGVLTGV